MFHSHNCFLSSPFLMYLLPFVSVSAFAPALIHVAGECAQYRGGEDRESEYRGQFNQRNSAII